MRRTRAVAHFAVAVGRHAPRCTTLMSGVAWRCTTCCALRADADADQRAESAPNQYLDRDRFYSDFQSQTGTCALNLKNARL